MINHHLSPTSRLTDEYTGPQGEEAEESVLACRSLLFRCQSLAAALPRGESRRLTVELSGS